MFSVLIRIGSAVQMKLTLFGKQGLLTQKCYYYALREGDRSLSPRNRINLFSSPQTTDFGTGYGNFLTFVERGLQNYSLYIKRCRSIVWTCVIIAMFSHGQQEILHQGSGVSGQVDGLH